MKYENKHRNEKIAKNLYRKKQTRDKKYKKKAKKQLEDKYLKQGLTIPGKTPINPCANAIHAAGAMNGHMGHAPMQ